MIKKILNYFKKLFVNKNYFKKIDDFTQEEIQRINEIQASFDEIKVIHKEISGVVQICSKSKEKADETLLGDSLNDFRNTRIKKDDIVCILESNGKIYIKDLPRKERQYYSKIIYRLKKEKGMKILFCPKNKFYKLKKND
jgi:spore maturation protein CgeB